ncbi:hypothetical protein D3C87_1770290 [compost metagenome]
MDCSEVEAPKVGGAPAGASKRQKNAASDPSLSIISSARPALLITASILPRWRTMPASASKACTCLSPNVATRAGSKLANPRRNASRLFRMVRQLSPD